MTLAPCTSRPALVPVRNSEASDHTQQNSSAYLDIPLTFSPYLAD